MDPALSGTDAELTLTRLGASFFDTMHSIDPLTATMLGVLGHDSELPDPGREASATNARRVRSFEAELAAIRIADLSRAGQVNHAVLSHLAWSLRTNLEDGLWAMDASAAGYVSPQSLAFQSIPTAPLGDHQAVAGYLRRLAGLGGYFDGVLNRYRDTTAAGRRSTAAGIRQAMNQLAGHLGRPLESDPLMLPLLDARSATDHDRGAAAETLRTSARPAMARLLVGLRDELLPSSRSDAEVGLRFVPGGEGAYRTAVRRHTTSDLTPDEIHRIGLELLAELNSEWEEVGSRVFGPIGPVEVRARLRDDPALRFRSSEEIVRMVEGALQRAEAIRDRWFPHFDIAPCLVEEIDQAEAGNAALAYYRGPSEDGRRTGAHCVLTTRPENRFSYEYEALAFHESTPGHHLQIASAQTLTHLPRFRRFLDAEVCSYVEGWGLYCERLADEMGLYTSDLQRLGMLSFDALRACRLVVDTGMHHLGWPRAQAVEFMWENTATTMANVANEIDRYIAWPGQALAYMIGRREIRRLRGMAEMELGARFDVREFHGVVLSEGAVPLPVLAQVVSRWIDERSRVQ